MRKNKDLVAKCRAFKNYFPHPLSQPSQAVPTLALYPLTRLVPAIKAVTLVRGAIGPAADRSVTNPEDRLHAGTLGLPLFKHGDDICRLPKPSRHASGYCRVYFKRLMNGARNCNTLRGRATSGTEGIPVFDDEVEAIRAAWRDLFGSQRPFSGESLDEYLTNYRAV